MSTALCILSPRKEMTVVLVWACLRMFRVGAKNSSLKVRYTEIKPRCAYRSSLVQKVPMTGTQSPCTKRWPALFQAGASLAVSEYERQFWRITGITLCGASIWNIKEKMGKLRAIATDLQTQILSAVSHQQPIN